MREEKESRSLLGEIRNRKKYPILLEKFILSFLILLPGIILFFIIRYFYG